ncbi:MAG TPA: hypothetical protein VN549_02115, partial [Negativicutes bacterium]|nr:hypothetical protein [Negativicutes bacterium]
YRGQEMARTLQELLDNCIEEVQTVSRQDYIYEIFDIERDGSELRLKGTALALPGKDICSHLSKADKCVVMAATLGLETDRRIALYSRTNLTRGIVFDASAGVAIESLCDQVQEEIADKAGIMGYDITQRFSPGYGDLPIDIQGDITRVLKAYERIGLGVNENSVMIPRKSVTALIGMQKEGCATKEHKCTSCDNKNCLYRKGEDNGK